MNQIILQKLFINFLIFNNKSKINFSKFLEYIEKKWIYQVELAKYFNKFQKFYIKIPIQISKLFIINLITFFQNNKNISSNLDKSIPSLGNSFFKLNSNSYYNLELFNNIAGINKIKPELTDIVLFLRNPEGYTMLSAKMPNGILLIGPPGTGKTLLAKEIANEANVPFYNMAGSEFIEMFVGLGATRVRDLFKKASKKKPCIIFIDELDAIGRKRGIRTNIKGGNDEREHTLNQLLIEMDGFTKNKGILLIGATNRIDMLDKALLRPGRFDRRIQFTLPTYPERIDILKIHIRKKLVANDVSLIELASRTAGFSGAGLANILNEAAILATRYNKDLITNDEINEVLDKLINGIIYQKRETSKKKLLVAYYEVGHAIVGYVLNEHKKIQKISLIPHRRQINFTTFIKRKKKILFTRSIFLKRIMTILAGHVTEKVVFGYPDVTINRRGHFRQATFIANRIVRYHSMSKLGPTRFKKGTQNKINLEIYDIIKYCEQFTEKIISDNRVILDLIVEVLLSQKVIYGDILEYLIKLYTLPMN